MSKIRYCYINGCKHYRGTPSESVKFFLSPKDDAMRMKWKTNIEKHKQIYDRYKLLCELHFEENALIRNRTRIELKKDAVPTLFPASTHPAPETTTLPIHDSVALEFVEVKFEQDDDVLVKHHTNGMEGLLEHNNCLKCPNLEEELRKYKSQVHDQKVKIFAFKNRLSETNIEHNAQITELNSKLDKQAVEIQSLIQAQNQAETECAVCQATMAPNHAHICNGDKEIKCHYCHEPLASTHMLMKHLHTSHPEKEFYKCDQCPKIYSMELLLAEHRKSHYGPEEIDVDEAPSNKPALDLSERLLKPFQCNDCGEMFAKPSELNLHMKNKEKMYKTKTHSEPPPPNSPAKLIKPVQECLQNDYEGHSPSLSTPSHPKKSCRPLQCTNCSSTFASLSEFRLHIRTKHKKSKQFECYICKLQFESKRQVRAHLDSHNRDKKCVVCLTQHTRVEIEQHMCYGMDTMQCVYCHENFSQMHSLLKHLEVCESEILIHRCEKCLKLFKMALLRDLHMKGHQGELDKYKCNICSKVFDSDEKLQRHEKNHTLPNAHLCDQCGKGFKWQSGLDHHKLFHRERTYECKQCDKKFTLSSGLRRHSYMHKDVKVACSICDVTLLNPQALSKHMKVHARTEADRVHQCTMCPKRFFEAQRAKYHMKRAHSNQRYTCEFCEQTFKYPGDLNKHKRQKHLGDYMYSCNDCPERFRLPYELERHKFKHYKPRG